MRFSNCQNDMGAADVDIGILMRFSRTSDCPDAI